MKLPSRRVNLGDIVVDQLLELLINGQYGPGDKLPTEPELAETFQVSRTVIREAIRKLRIFNVVTVRQGDGTFVNEVTMDSFMKPITPLIALNRPEQDQLFAARLVVEPGVAFLCGNHDGGREGDEFDVLDDAFSYLEASIRQDNIRDYSQAEMRMKLALARFCHNPVLSSVSEAISPLIAKQMEIVNSYPGMLEFSFVAYQKLLDDIKAGEATAAEDGVRHLLKTNFTALQKNLNGGVTNEV